MSLKSLWTAAEDSRFAEFFRPSQVTVEIISGTTMLILFPLYGYMKAAEFLPWASPWVGVVLGIMLALLIIWHACPNGRKALIYKYFFRGF